MPSNKPSPKAAKIDDSIFDDRSSTLDLRFKRKSAIQNPQFH
jgi:hypothetical protein